MKEISFTVDENGTLLNPCLTDGEVTRVEFFGCDVLISVRRERPFPDCVIGVGKCKHIFFDTDRIQNVISEVTMFPFSDYEGVEIPFLETDFKAHLRRIDRSINYQSVREEADMVSVISGIVGIEMIIVCSNIRLFEVD